MHLAIFGVNTSNASEVDAIAALIQKDYQNNKNENPVATFSNTSSQATTNNNTRTRTLANKIRIAAVVKIIVKL